MDESTVRQAAEEHGKATVAGDLKRAGSDLDKSAYDAAGAVMKAMPPELSSCEVTDVRQDGDAWVATIKYVGDGEATVESRWVDQEGRPRIVDLQTR